MLHRSLQKVYELPYCDIVMPWALSRGFSGDCRVVTAHGSGMDRRAVHACAVYLRRENHYDFVPYSAKEEWERRGFKTDVAYSVIYVDPSVGFRERMRNGEPDGVYGKVIGALCYRARRFKDEQGLFLWLSWLWVNPIYRRRGIAGRCHETMQNVMRGYGFDHVDGAEGPFTDAGRSFCEKHGLIVAGRR